MKVLELTRLLGALWQEMTELRESAVVLMKENEDLMEAEIVAGGRRVEGNERSVKARKKSCLCHLSRE